MTTLYATNGCMGCRLTAGRFKEAGIDFEYVNLNDNPDRMADIAHLGYTEAPVVVSGDEHWSGFRPNRIAQLIHEKVAA